jgi:hypothetical protein
MAVMAIATPRRRAIRARPNLGGTAGNEVLTGVTALVLALLLAVEGVTLLFLHQLLPVHMFVGLALIGPVVLKLASTGYRFARYYTRSAAYRVKGPPALPLRMLAPVLVVTTVLVLASGVALLLIGHHSDTVLLVHKASFIVWSAVFAIHFLAYLPRAVRSMAPREAVSGTAARAGALAVSLAAGAALALALLDRIGAWHRGPFG